MNKYCEKCNRTQRFETKFCNMCGSELIMGEKKNAEELGINDALKNLLTLIDLTNDKISLIDQRLDRIESKKPKKEIKPYKQWNQKTSIEWEKRFETGLEALKEGNVFTTAMEKAKISNNRKDRFIKYCKDRGMEVKIMTPIERSRHIYQKKMEKKQKHEQPMLRDKPYIPSKTGNIGGTILSNIETKPELPQIKNVMNMENLIVCVNELLVSPLRTEITFKENGWQLGINNFGDWGEFCISFMSNANKIARYFKVANEFRFNWSNAKISYG